MDTPRKLWIGLGALLVASFAVLLWMGRDIEIAAPPMPESVVTKRGDVLYTRADIERGRQVWQSIGGQQLGSIWGHGALVAPDWSADWLHRETLASLELASRAGSGVPYATLREPEQARLQSAVRERLRANTYDEATGRIVVDDARALAIAQVAAHYESLFSNDPATAKLRESYAMRNDTVPDAASRRELTGFFFWTAWAAGTERPGYGKTYTNNWPYDPVAGNVPTSGTFLWSMFSILFMIAGIGLLAWHHAVWHGREPAVVPPARDPLAGMTITPSMRATAKYFWLVVALFLVQILLGATTAHYQVEGQNAYGFPLADVLPYSITRSWHTQLAVLWIATAWLGTGLYIGPAISGHEPRFQRLGVNFLWTCLIVIVVGAFALTAGGPRYVPLLEMDAADVREALSAHVVLRLEVARNAKAKMRPGGTLILMGGTGGRRIDHRLGIVSAATATMPPFTAALALELAPIRVNLIAAGFVDTPLSASLLGINSRTAAAS